MGNEMSFGSMAYLGSLALIAGMSIMPLGAVATGFAAILGGIVGLSNIVKKERMMTILAGIGIAVSAGTAKVFLETIPVFGGIMINVATFFMFVAGVVCLKIMSENMSKK